MSTKLGQLINLFHIWDSFSVSLNMQNIKICPPLSQLAAETATMIQSVECRAQPHHRRNQTKNQHLFET